MVMIVAPRIQQLGFEEFQEEYSNRQKNDTNGLRAKNHAYVNCIYKNSDLSFDAPELEEDAPPRPPTPVESRLLARTVPPDNLHQLVNRSWRQDNSRPYSPSSTSSSSSDAEENRWFQYRRGPPPPPPHREHHGTPSKPKRPPYPLYDRHCGPPPPPPPPSLHHYGHHWSHHHNHHHHHQRHHYRGYRDHYGPPLPPPPPPHHYEHRGPLGYHQEPSLSHRSRHGQLESGYCHCPPRGHRANEKNDGHRGHQKHRQFSSHRNYYRDAHVEDSNGSRCRVGSH